MAEAEAAVAEAESVMQDAVTPTRSQVASRVASVPAVRSQYYEVENPVRTRTVEPEMDPGERLRRGRHVTVAITYNL